MASRNFHKRRTKERKARQREQRRQEAKQRAEGLRRFRSADPLLVGAGMSAAAGLALMAAASDALARRVPLIVAEPHAPKMFVKDGKKVPFESL